MPIPRRPLIRVAVTVLIIAIIVAIWFLKNRPETEEPIASPPTVGTVRETASSGNQSIEPPEPAGADALEVIEKTSPAAAAIEPTVSAELQKQVASERGNPNPNFLLNVAETLDLEHLKSYGLPIMIDFGADSCIPCKEMAPILKDLNARLQGKAIIRFIDVWKNPKLAEGYPIRVIPTQLFFNSEGKPYLPSDPDASRMLMYVLKDTQEHVFTAHEGGMTEQMILDALFEMGLAHD